MANVDWPHGLIPLQPTVGELRLRRYYVEEDDIHIGRGDPVTLEGDADSRGVPSVVRSTVGTGNRITAVVTGCEAAYAGGADPDLSKTYIASGTSGYVWAVDVEGAYFMIQDNAGAALSAGNIGENANLVSAHGLSTGTGWTGLELNAGTTSTTSNFQLQLVGMVDRPDNDLGSSCEWIVRVNQTTHRSDYGGTGV